ncbi:hypothetical protein U4960_15780 [Altererythrobacter sp. H2]|uniref:hypothetical protein n=1 Tax=Altererythrobacter sp. H2 TaxID=3108391 RepID=UPI002B4BC186|nr:hypothetical protein [Altererythrobacter sp. H2]WRK95712.1 hypothetical protein U4960_15780 [Altererythrobacter sp. H2]
MTPLEDWLQPASIEFAVYTPGDLERVSGLSGEMQRVWRRRGHLPSPDSGHARFTGLEVLEITIRTALSKAGIPPSETEIDLTSATKAAMYYAVFSHGAVEVIGPTSKVDHFLNVFEENGELGLRLVGNPPASPFFVMNDKRESRIVDNADDLILDHEELNLVYNLRSLGERLVERGRKPIIVVTWPNESNERFKRRLTNLI